MSYSTKKEKDFLNAVENVLDPVCALGSHEVWVAPHSLGADGKRRVYVGLGSEFGEVKVFRLSLDDARSLGLALLNAAEGDTP